MGKKFLFPIIMWVLLVCESSNAYPIFAQQNYDTPREANGRIVCANCHLAQSTVQLDVPQAVLPGIVFEAKARIPYDRQLIQVLGNGKRGPLNVGAVLLLPDGFQLAPLDRLTTRAKKKVTGLYFQPYRVSEKNILVVGPVPGRPYQNITFPILAPSPTSESKVGFGKYTVYLGRNKGRGQVYPDGSKSNNTIYAASRTGVIKDILPGEKAKGFQVKVETDGGNEVIETVPTGPELLVKKGQRIRAEQPLTNNPNVGGFGQTEEEIILQCPERIQRLLVLFAVIFFTQVFLIMKKKQFEKFQLAEQNFLGKFSISNKL